MVIFHSWLDVDYPSVRLISQVFSLNIPDDYPLVNIQKAMENDHLYWVFPLKIVIFHSYVSLPEGIWLALLGLSHKIICAFIVCMTT